MAGVRLAAHQTSWLTHQANKVLIETSKICEVSDRLLATSLRCQLFLITCVGYLDYNASNSSSDNTTCVIRWTHLFRLPNLADMVAYQTLPQAVLWDLRDFANSDDVFSDNA